MGTIRRILIGGAVTAACVAGLLVADTGFAFKATAQEESAETPPQTQQLDGPTALSETYQDWVVNCHQVRGADGTATRLCQMSQELRQQDSNQLVLLISIAANVATTPRATIIAPFGLKLSEGIGLVLAEREIIKAPFDTCLPAGCLAYLDLSPESLDKLRASETVQIVLQPSQSLDSMLVTISLAGFTTAWNRLNSL